MVEELCRSCQARVLWATTEAGKAMPLDALPHPEGNILLDKSTGRCRVQSGRDAAAEGAGPRYRSHFATCPQARNWRRPRA
jgi:hypothetical protein